MNECIYIYKFSECEWRIIDNFQKLMTLISNEDGQQGVTEFYCELY